MRIKGVEVVIPVGSYKVVDLIIGDALQELMPVLEYVEITNEAAEKLEAELGQKAKDDEKAAIEKTKRDAEYTAQVRGEATERHEANREARAEARAKEEKLEATNPVAAEEPKAGRQRKGK